MRISTRSQTAPFIAMDVLAAAQAIEAGGGKVTHMELGEPAHGAPRAACDALAAAMNRGETLGYTNGLGLGELRSAIATLYRRRHGIDLDPARVAATPGLDFDPVRGHGTMRLSFAQAPKVIAEGIARISRFIEAGAG